MSSLISVEADVDKVVKALDGTAKSLPTIRKQALGVIGRNASNKVKTVIRSTIHGDGIIAHKYPYVLAKGYTYKVGKSAYTVSVYPKNIEEGRANDLTIPVVVTLNYGGTIKRKRTAGSVTIRGRRFFDAAETYVNNGSYMSDLDVYVQKELNKYWG